MNIKKILGWAAFTAFFVFMVWAFSYAVDMDVWQSSTTATQDVLQNLCPGKTYVIGTSSYTEGNHGVFHGACIGLGVAASSVTVYNSSATATNPIAIISASTPTLCSFYDVAVSSGLTYTIGAAGVTMTFLYQCY